MRTYQPQRAKTLDGIAVDDMTATEAAEHNLAAFKDNGIRVARNWDRRAPFVEHLGRGEWLIRDRTLLDHLYRLRYPNGRVVYATEPYGLDESDLRDLGGLLDEGWSVRIGQMPLWYPGRTTQVLIERRPASA